MSVIGNPLLLSPEGYQIERSVRLRSSASAYFNRTPASAGNQRTWTWSGWVKRGALGVRQFITMSGVNPNPSQVWQVEFDANNKLDFYNQTIGTYRRTTQVFRDVGAWYHIVFGADTNNATAQNRFRCWVNGVEVTAWDVNSTISSGYTFAYNGAYLHGIGAYTYSGNGLPLDGYLTDVNFIDGQALTPSSFGETDAVTGVWKPKKYAGTYGTNGFFLNFSDPSSTTTIGYDYSGNGNNWTSNNISVTAGVTYDSMLDVPTLYADGGNGRGNYAVLNGAAIGTDATLANGNLSISYGASTPFLGTPATIGVQSGKWYWEVLITASSGATVTSMIGITTKSSPNEIGSYPGANVNGWGYFGFNGQKYNSGGTAYGATYTTNDVIGVAFDADAGTLEFYKNGVSQGTAFSGLTSNTYFPAIGDGSGGATFSAAINFGQRPFAYTPPTGFKALNTQNLPEPTIVDGGEYFNTVTYAGNSTNLDVTGVGFQPDFTWIKARNNGAASHWLTDAVRGDSKGLQSNSVGAEITSLNIGPTPAADGFQVRIDASNYTTNGNGYNYVAWNWKANGAGVSNTDGSITSTVSAGVTQGFSVVTYTGTGSNATVGHGLGVAPSMVIVKSRSQPQSWVVWFKGFAGTEYLLLNATAAKGSAANIWNSTVPTSSVFSIGTDVSVNINGATQVAYCFAEVPGFSKFGSYTGNGSADGPFQYLGFAPAFIMLKRTDSTGNWSMYDRARSPKNADTKVLYPNLSNAEDASTDHFDWLSNGFKMKSTNQNTNGGTFIYMAFAESPFKNSLAR